MCWREGLGVVKGECFSGLSPQVWKCESRGSVPRPGGKQKQVSQPTMGVPSSH